MAKGILQARGDPPELNTKMCSLQHKHCIAIYKGYINASAFGRPKPYLRLIC
jgi:hypothetical protein